MVLINDLITTTLCLGIIIGAILQYLLMILLFEAKKLKQQNINRRNNYLRLKAGNKSVKALEEWENK